MKTIYLFIITILLVFSTAKKANAQGALKDFNDANTKIKEYYEQSKKQPPQPITKRTTPPTPYTPPQQPYTKSERNAAIAADKRKKDKQEREKQDRFNQENQQLLPDLKGVEKRDVNNPLGLKGIEKTDANNPLGLKGIKTSSSQYATTPTTKPQHLRASSDIPKQISATQTTANKQYKSENPTIKVDKSQVKKGVQSAVNAVYNYSDVNAAMLPVNKIMDMGNEGISQMISQHAGYSRSLANDEFTRNVVREVTSPVSGMIRGEIENYYKENKIKFIASQSLKGKISDIGEFVSEKYGMTLRAIDNARWIIKFDINVGKSVFGDVSSVLRDFSPPKFKEINEKNEKSLNIWINDAKNQAKKNTPL